MQEKKLLKELEQDASNHMITTSIIDKILDEKEINSLFNKKKSTTFIKENYNTILNGVAKGYLLIILRELYNYKELEEYIDKNIINTIKNAENYEVPSIIDTSLKVKDEEDKKEFLKANIEDILENTEGEYVYKYLKYKNLDEKIYKSLNNYIKDNKTAFFKSFFKKGRDLNSKIDIPKIEYIYQMIIEEVLNHENKNYADLEYIGDGTFSEVIGIGDKVIKIGIKRNTYNIPHDKRILEPLIRKNFDKMNCVIEVSEKVDTNVQLNEEELYSFYKEVRERGIILADLKSANIGRLLKDNKKHWNKTLGESKEALGFTDYNEKDYLKKGELVLLDTDGVYKENDKSITWGNLRVKGYEERYKQELELERRLEEIEEKGITK